MPISEKTRKTLWGKSGNRCAICRRELSVDATSTDDESVVGEECHIVSGKTQGPRHDPTYSAARFDDATNLILLCRVHHKVVDDQTETYTVQKLQQLRAGHEICVASLLTETPRIRVRRLKDNVPTPLVRLASGRDVMAIVEHACAGVFDHDDPTSPEEVDLFSRFLQEAQDWADLSADLEAGDRVKAVFSLNILLQELEQEGFWVFGAREIKRIEGGVGGPALWPESTIRIVRATNPEIIEVDLSAEAKPA